MHKCFIFCIYLKHTWQIYKIIISLALCYVKVKHALTTKTHNKADTEFVVWIAYLFILFIFKSYITAMGPMKPA